MRWEHWRARLHDARPWLALIGLWLLFELPSAVQADGLSLRDVRPSGDVLLLCSVWALAHAQPFGRFVRPLLRVVAGVLVWFRLDCAVCAALMRQAPVLYDQAFLLPHLGVLIKDLWSAWLALGLGAFVALIALGARAARRLTGVFAGVLAPQRLQRTRGVFAALWCALVLSTLWPLLLGSSARYVHWVSVELAQSVTESLRIRRSIEHNLLTTPYSGYDAITLQRRPRVLFFFVESYGRMLTSDPALARPWLRELASMEHDLSRRGWHFASAYSEAPVSGGRSWLAHASVFTGTRISHQALFQRVVADRPGAAPSLVRFLRRQGYNTVLLAPGDSERLGVPIVNYYGYNQALRAQQLHYTGPGFGWGTIPDQYSVTYAQDHYLRGLPEASLVVFNLVSSHAPWRRVPQLMNDDRSVDAYRRQVRQPSRPGGSGPSAASAIVSALESYSRTRPRWNGPMTAHLPAAYLRSVIYDLELIRRYLRDQSGDTLVVVMGDHQPPLITAPEADFDVPIHVFARDRTLLHELFARGFSASLHPHPRYPTVVRHEALFSLLVRTLVRSCAPGVPMPPLLSRGARLDP